MPIGVIFCSSSIIIGGILGTLFGKYLSVDFKEKINMVFGACALAMGITSVMLMKNMPGSLTATDSLYKPQTLIKTGFQSYFFVKYYVVFCSYL